MTRSESAAVPARDATGRVCPWQSVGHIDNWLRPRIHDPVKLFGPHVAEGMTALDIGCGGGFVAIGLARLVGPSGRVIAADLQPEMLAAVEARAVREGVAARVELLRTVPDRLGVAGPVDFGVAFFMVHEVPDRTALLREIFAALRPGGRLFIAEPLFHVGRKDFGRTLSIAAATGFETRGRPRVLGGRAVVLERP